MATAPDAVNISGNFFPKEFAAVLHHLKPDKAVGPDFVSPELVIHAGPSLKFGLRGFLSSCLCQLKILESRESLEKSAGSRDP